MGYSLSDYSIFLFKFLLSSGLLRDDIPAYSLSSWFSLCVNWQKQIRHHTECVDEIHRCSFCCLELGAALVWVFWCVVTTATPTALLPMHSEVFPSARPVLNSTALEAVPYLCRHKLRQRCTVMCVHVLTLMGTFLWFSRAAYVSTSKA